MVANSKGRAKVIAFHESQELKDFVLNQLAIHREADKLVKGDYWNDGKGCAVGCTLEAVRLHNGKFSDGINHRSHALYESELGIPIIIAKLEDRFFESLPNGESQNWPERFTNTIAPGSNLAMVWPKFAYWLLTEEVPLHIKNEKAKVVLAEVAALYKEWIDGTKPIAERWLNARKKAHAAYAAYAAAAAAADAAAAAYAAAAAAAAADAAAAYAAAAYADATATDAAAYAAYADATAARIASYRRQADKLIEILKAS